jgi:hypothetical protein
MDLQSLSDKPYHPPFVIPSLLVILREPFGIVTLSAARGLAFDASG